MAGQKRKRSRKNEYLARRARQRKQSDLLELPSEIRNEIFKIALSAVDGLVVRFTPGVSRRKKKPMLVEEGNPDQEFNQIKYVSRQLYKETAGVGVQFNWIIFEKPDIQASAHRFRSFAKRFTPNKFGWLKAVAIVANTDGDHKHVNAWFRGNLKVMLELLDLCAGAPHLTLCLHIRDCYLRDLSDHTNYTAYKFLEFGIILELMFRESNISHILPHRGSETARTYDKVVRELLSKDMSTFQTLCQQAPNLKLFPMDLRDLR